jgi:hypothetical protein
MAAPSFVSPSHEESQATPIEAAQPGRGATRLKQHGKQWLLERCMTQEGLRLTLTSAAEANPMTFYLPLGYDVEPTCS